MSGSEAAIVLGAGALSVAGVAFALLAATMAKRVTDYVGLLGGVVILLVAITHLAPEALEAGNVERMFLLGGAAAGVVLELIFRARSTPSPSTQRVAAWLGVILLAIHSTLDGAVYTAVFWHGEGSGLLASLGLILHEAPEGVVAMALALQAGLRPPIAAMAAILASSVTTPIGWVIAHAIGESGHGVMQAMFAASAGLLLYVGWHLIAGGWRALRAKGSV
ncbi:MAG TPA: ZIP family metal transporter [Hyphomonadaceae bacterium]|mgnify:FL=1|nr:ZIP family metal transporter [Hyphomonadaceae bacterium]HPI48606.1 ZIP family metal transporter [Hyphomonadaceae bacterium]